MSDPHLIHTELNIVQTHQIGVEEASVGRGGVSWEETFGASPPGPPPRQRDSEVKTSIR